MSFTNVYYKRAVATAKSCYVCYRPTTTVLATINTVDFLYACPGHLTDSNFATRIADEAAKPTIPPEEIEKIKKEWEEQQKKKKAQAADKDEKKEDGKAEESPKEPAKSPSPHTPSTPGPAKAGHEKYSLHRDFYAMRQQEHKKRRQAAQAKELAPRLPGVPIGAVSPPPDESKY